MGRSRAARYFRIVKYLASDKEFTLFCKPRTWVNNWLTVAGFLSWCMDNIARSVSSQQILLNSSISWQSFARFSRKSLFLISKSPHKLIFSLWAWSVQWFACCSCNRWDSNSWLISLRAISECLFSQCLTSTSASASKSLCWRPIQLSVQGFCGDFASLLMFFHDVWVSISFLPWHRFENTWNNCFVIHVCSRFPGAGLTCNRIIIRSQFPGARQQWA